MRLPPWWRLVDRVSGGTVRRRRLRWYRVPFGCFIVSSHTLRLPIPLRVTMFTYLYASFNPSSSAQAMHIAESRGRRGRRSISPSLRIQKSACVMNQLYASRDSAFTMNALGQTLAIFIATISTPRYVYDVVRASRSPGAFRIRCTPGTRHNDCTSRRIHLHHRPCSRQVWSHHSDAQWGDQGSPISLNIHQSTQGNDHVHTEGERLG